MLTKEKPLVIYSLNIASGQREEKNNPLERRLPMIIEMLQDKSNYMRKEMSVLCVQEITATGSLSVQQVINKISHAIGDWRSIDMNPNSSSGGLVRATFYDDKKLHHIKTDIEIVENVLEPQYPRMIMVSFFCERDGDPAKVFAVINAHAPVEKRSRLACWKATKKIAIG